LTANGGPTGASTWKASPGMHTLMATADDINRFPESNEGNNAMTVNLSISSGPPRVNQISVSTNGAVSFTFTATAGIQYRVQCKDRLNDAQWVPLGQDIGATSNTVSVSDSVVGVAQRYYRVLQLN
jgi:hypothetical protein